MSAYGSGSQKGKFNYFILLFWNYLNHCLQSFGKNMGIILLDLTARFIDEIVEDVVGRHGVPGRKKKWRKNGSTICREMVVRSTLFKKDIHKYT